MFEADLIDVKQMSTELNQESIILIINMLEKYRKLILSAKTSDISVFSKELVSELEAVEDSMIKKGS